MDSWGVFISFSFPNIKHPCFSIYICPQDLRFLGPSGKTSPKATGTLGCAPRGCEEHRYDRERKQHQRDAILSSPHPRSVACARLGALFWGSRGRQRPPWLQGHLQFHGRAGGRILETVGKGPACSERSGAPGGQEKDQLATRLPPKDS